MILAERTPGRGEELGNPFKGLAYFDSGETDQFRFGGRERDITAVTNGILRSRTLVLYGRSGLGKTSLLLAGVFPELKLHGCTPVHVRTLEDPLADLKDALANLVPEVRTDDLRELIEAVSEKDNRSLVVLVFDQFEEFFIRFASPLAERGVAEDGDAGGRERIRRKRQVFIQEIGRLAADSTLNLRLVWSLREDWFAEMQDFASAIPEITGRVYRLLPLTAFGVRESILRSLKSAGVAFDTRLISELVDTLAEYGFDPAILQVVCSEVWKTAVRSEERPIRLGLKHLEAMGGVSGVFHGYLGRVTDEIRNDDHRMKIQVRAVFDSLVTERRTKRAIKKLDFRRRGFAIELDELDRVLNLLTEHRLVRKDRRGGEDWYELIHERLIEIILGWLDTDRDFFNFRAARNLVENSCRNPGWEENPDLLLNPGQLDGTVGPFKDLFHFGARPRLFLVSSATYARSKDLEFWVQNAGLDTSLHLLEDLLNVRDNDVVRERAAEAAGRVKASAERFAPRLLELAMEDGNERVRRAAGRSFAHLASEAHFLELVDRLRKRRSRVRATDVLADVIDADKLPGSVAFGRLRLRAARQRLFRRRVHASIQELGERRRRGALMGLLASIVWVTTAGALGLRVLLRELYPRVALQGPGTWLMSLGICVLVALPLGALMGWLTTRRAGRDALFEGREVTSYRTLYGPGPRFLSWLMLSSFAVFFVFDVGTLWAGGRFEMVAAWARVAGPMVAYLALLAWCGLVASGARKSMRFGSKANWVRAWPWAFGGSLLLPLGAWVIIGSGATSDSLPGPLASPLEVLLGPIVHYLVASAIVGGLVIYVGILSPTLTRKRSEPEIAGDRRAWWKTRRFLGYGLSAATLLLLFHANGTDGLIGSVRVVDSDPVDVDIQFGPALNDARYLTLLSKKPFRGQPRLMDVELSDNLFAATASGPIASGSTLVVTGAMTQMALWPGVSRGGNYKLVLRPDQMGDDEPVVAGRWQLAVVRAEQMPEGWIVGHLSRRLAHVGDDEEIRVVVAAEGLGGDWCEGWSMKLEIPSLPTGAGVVPPVACKTEVPSANFGRAPLVLPGADTLDLRLQLRDLRRPVVLPHEDTVTSVGFYPDSYPEPLGASTLRPLALTASGNTVMLWLAGTVSQVPQGRPIIPHNGQVNSAVFDEDGRRVVTASADHTAIVANVDGTILQTLQHDGELNGASFSHDGTRVVTASADGVARIWDLSGEGKVLHELPHEGTTVWKASFSHDDELVATASGAGAFLWAAQSGEPIRALRNPGSVYVAVFSPDDRLLVTGGEDKKARVWSVARSKDDAAEVLPHESAVWSVAFSPDGNRIATGCSDGTVRLWLRGDSGKFEAEDVVLRSERGIWSVAFSLDGGSLLTGSADKTARIWSLKGSGIPSETGAFYFFVKFGSFPRGG